MSDGITHVVGVKSLRVVLSHDETGWFAQGLEIDYAAAGSSMESAQANFEQGLALTVHEHLKLYGDIEKLLRVAPPDAWKSFFEAPSDTVKATYSSISAHQLLQRIPSRKKKAKDQLAFTFPFEKIEFFGGRVAVPA